MFGNHTQDNQSNSTSGSYNYSDELPAGGDDLLSTSYAQQSSSNQSSSDSPVQSSSTSDDNLIAIKQQALQQLTPLVDQLDQTIEEKFKTTMMMIQASDNKYLIKTAFDLAQKISNDKERAQALLDVINEINYFSQASN